jgi:DNA-binding NarL/FixJ family response regulator
VTEGFVEKPQGKYTNLNCGVRSSCLDCPLDNCLEEISHGLQKMRLKQRELEMIDMRKQGMTYQEISRKTMFSVRTVFRVFAGIKKKIE